MNRKCNCCSTSMHWEMSHRADIRVLPLANRHYTRQSPESRQFVPPGRCLVLRLPEGGAYWVTSWPFAEYVKHRWPGWFVCSAFRNETKNPRLLSSELIRQAVAVTRWRYPEAGVGMVTFVREECTSRGRGRRSTPGQCFVHAGFEPDGFTKGGLHALVMHESQMPEPQVPLGAQFAY
jgi:hypothetical protein